MLRKWNNLTVDDVIREGQQLIVGQDIIRNRKIKVPWGTSLSVLARRYKTTVGKLMAWNGLKSPKDLQAGRNLIVARSIVRATYARPADEYKTIRVPVNATLSELAQQYRVSVSQLMAWNNIRHASKLKAGQRLIVSERRMDHPSTSVKQKTIRVRRGDSLWKLARQYRTSVANLIALNDLKSAHQLYPNQKLIVPAR